MPEGTTGDSLQDKRYGGQYYKYRKSFVHLTRGNVLAAIILQVFYHELELRRSAYEVVNASRAVRGKKPAPPNFWIEMSWLHLLHKLYLVDPETGKRYLSEPALRANVQKLVEAKLLIQRPHPSKPKSLPNQFLVNIDVIQAFIDAQPEEPVIPDTSYLLAATEEDLKGFEVSEEGEGESEKSTHETPSNERDKKDTPQDSLPSGGKNLYPRGSKKFTQGGKESLPPSPSEGVKKVYPNVDDSCRLDSVDDSVEIPPSSPPVSLSPSVEGANALLQMTLEVPVEGRPPLYVVPSHTRQTAPSQWDTRYQCDPLHAEDLFDTWRGGPPTIKADILAQQKNCQSLARLGTLMDIVNVRTEMYSFAPDYWSKPEHRESIEAYHVLKYWHEFRRRRSARLANEKGKDMTHHDEQSTSIPSSTASEATEKRRAFSQYKGADEF